MSGDVVQRLAELADLRTSGKLTEYEFTQAKQRLLAETGHRDLVVPLGTDRASTVRTNDEPTPTPYPGSGAGTRPGRTGWRRVVLIPLVVVVLAGAMVALAVSGGTSCPGTSVATGQPGWSTDAPSHRVGRYMHAAATGCDGRIYLMGGLTTPVPDDATSTRLEPSVEVLDPTSGAWSMVAPLPTPRYALAGATGTDGRIYAIGGEVDGPAYDTVPTVEAFDPGTGRWTSVAPLPEPLSRMGAVTSPDGRIWVVADRATYVYTPSTDTWAPAAAMPTPRSHHAVAMGQDGRIYALGGFSRDGQLTELATVESYLPESDRWRPEPPMPTARAEFAAVTAPDGRIVVVGGGRVGPQDAVYLRDPDTGVWTSGPTMPAGRSDHVATVAADGRIVVLSGHRADEPTFLQARDVLLLTP